ncbi:MAG: oligopeptide/dipeptide ABC transporter ATP-binding protein, partial [Planctomycetota bacterium]
LTYLFITHDLRTVQYLADEVCVMYLGRIVERGTTDEIFGNPQHPYTRALLEAIPETDPTSGARKVVVSGDVPSPINPPPGCPFHRRCEHAMEVCRAVWPQTERTGGRHQVNCFLYGTGGAALPPELAGTYAPDPLPAVVRKANA